MANVPQFFPYFRFQGSHFEIGKQYGEQCKDLIIRHRDLALQRLRHRQHISEHSARENALKYRDFVVAHAPFFDDEVQGLAAGAGLSIEDAWLLQLRAELGVITEADIAEEAGDECTTFAVLPEATLDGIGMLGQNADLPFFYSEIGIVAEMVFDDMPAVLMLLPAGQLSYIGINDQGLGICANYLTCDGWRLGFPRYLLSRLALTQTNVSDALAAIRGVDRASSRNLLLLDSIGNAVDLETTVTSDAAIDPTNGIIAHANHYTHSDLLAFERSKPHHVQNSQQRHELMRSKLHEKHGLLSPAEMQQILRSRDSAPDCLCRTVADQDGSDGITFASFIAQPSEKKMWVAVGPPNEHDYYAYEFGGQPRKEELLQMQANA